MTPRHFLWYLVLAHVRFGFKSRSLLTLFVITVLGGHLGRAIAELLIHLLLFTNLLLLIATSILRLNMLLLLFITLTFHNSKLSMHVEAGESYLQIDLLATALDPLLAL